MNAAALKTNLKALKKGGKIIVNTDGFDAKNLRLANYPDGVNPIEDDSLANYEVTRMDITKMTREALKEFPWAPRKKTVLKTCLCSDFFTGCITGIWTAQSSS